MKKIIISSALAVLASCSKTSGLSNTSAIIGDDERKASVEESLTKTLGIILLNGEAICTGFISAAGEITTAAHCIDVNMTSFTFRTFQGEQSDIVGVKKIFSKADVVKLSADVVAPGLIIGAFDPNAKTALVAFDSESSTMVVTNSGTAELNRGVIYHTLDTVPGSSGGALVQNNSIVGVHIGNISPSQNVAISLSTVGDADISGLAVTVEGCKSFWH